MVNKMPKKTITNKKTGKTTVTKTKAKKSTKKTTKKATEKKTSEKKIAKKSTSKGFILELEIKIMKSFMTTFKNAEVETIFMVSDGKGNLWLVGLDTSNVSMVSFRLEKLPNKVKLQGKINTEKFSAYLDTFRGKTFEMSVLPAGSLKLESGRIRHKMSFEESTADDLEMFDGIDGMGCKEYEDASVFNVDSSDFADVIHVGSKLSFVNEIRFGVENGELEVSYIPENKVDESIIDLPADVIEEGDTSFCLFPPKFVKSFSIFSGTFELHVDDEEPLRGLQQLVIGEKEYPLRMIIIIASHEETGEQASTAGDGKDNMLINDMDTEGEPEEIPLDNDENYEENEEDEKDEKDDEDDEDDEIIYDDED